LLVAEWRVAGALIGRARQQDRQDEVKKACRQQEVAGKCSSHFEVAEIESCQQIEDEQCLGGLRGSGAPGPARYCEREESETADTADGNSALGEVDTKEYVDDEGRAQDQGRSGCCLKTSG